MKKTYLLLILSMLSITGLRAETIAQRAIRDKLATVRAYSRSLNLYAEVEALLQAVETKSLANRDRESAKIVNQMRRGERHSSIEANIAELYTLLKLDEQLEALESAVVAMEIAG